MDLIFRLILVLLTSSIFSSPTYASSSSEWLIDLKTSSFGSIGKLSKLSRESDLIKALGPSAVKRGFYEDEGTKYPCTYIYKGDSMKEARIIWWKQSQYVKPESITFFGKNWNTASGVRCGITAKQLEQLNKEPFEITGFQSCGPLSVESWRKGKLQKELETNNLKLTICLSGKSNDPLLTDLVPLSSDKAIRKLNLVVSEMYVSF